MSFKIIIEVPDTKLAATLKKLNGHKVYVENVHEDSPQVQSLRLGKKKKKNPKRMHNRAETILTMTGKTPSSGSKLFVAREVFEKLEKRLHIGNVTVADFRAELVKKGEDEKLCQRSVTKKVLAYVD